MRVDESRGDYVFAGQAQTFPSVNCVERKALGLAGEDVDIAAATLKYLSDYTLTVSSDADADSEFEITVLAFDASNGSQLADSQGTPIAFTVGDACTLSVRCQSVTPVEIGATPSATVCEGETVTLDAGAGFSSYLWSPGGETTQSIEVSDAGTYSVTVTDDQDCFATDSIGVTVAALPTCSISGAVEACPGSTFEVSAAAGLASYDWTVAGGSILSGQGTRNILIKSGKGPKVDVDLAVTNSAGCAGSCSKTVAVSDQEPPVITNCPATLTVALDAECIVSSIPADLGVNVSDNCTSLSNLTFATDPADLSGLQIGDNEVTVTVTDAAGNEATCTVTVTVEQGECPEGPPVGSACGAGLCGPSAVSVMPLLILGLLAWKLQRRASRKRLRRD